MGYYVKADAGDYDDMLGEVLDLAYAIVAEPIVSDGLFASAIDTIYNYSLWQYHVKELPEKALTILRDRKKEDYGDEEEEEEDAD